MATDMSLIGVLFGMAFLMFIIFMLLWENMKLRKDRHELIIPEGKEITLIIRTAKNGHEHEIRKGKSSEKDSSSGEEEQKAGAS